jgi:regulatory protein
VAEAKPKPAKPYGAAELDEAALRYLNRFDATAKKLSDHLARVARKRGELEAARPLIEALIQRYQRSGLIDDRRFARRRAEALQARGASRRLVSLKLVHSGVARDIVDEVLGERRVDTALTSELEAAAAYVKRKRLGRFRSGEVQPDMRRKDLARLARQGFDFDTAVRALGQGGEDDF